MDNTLKKQLKSQAHHLSPVVLMGAKGLTDGLIAECDLALTIHELIKIKIVSADKQERVAIATTLCQATNAELIQTIGHIAVLYRKNPA